MAIKHIGVVLEYLKKRGPVAQSQLSRVLNINYYSICNVLEFLEERGEVESKQDGTFIYWDAKKKVKEDDKNDK